MDNEAGNNVAAEEGWRGVTQRIWNVSVGGQVQFGGVKPGPH